MMDHLLNNCAGPMRVLIIDDDPDDALLTVDFIREREDLSPCRVSHVSTYAEGVGGLLEGEFEVCLLDYHLGARDGLELLTEVRAKGCETPIILLTGQDNAQLAAKAIKSGACDYVNKNQLSGEVLSLALRNALKLAKEGAARKQAEQALDRNRRILSTAFNAIQDSLMVIDRDHKVIMSNQRGTGLCEECDDTSPCHGLYCYQVAHHRKSACDVCHLHTVFESGEVKRFEHYDEPSGQYYDTCVSPIKNDEGEVILVVEHLRNITERKKRENQLAEYRDHLEAKVAAKTRELTKALASAERDKSKLAAVIRSMGDGLVVTDEHDTITSINHAAMAFFGSKGDLPLGTCFLRLAREAGADSSFATSLARARKDGRVEFSFMLPKVEYGTLATDEERAMQHIRAKTTAIHDSWGNVTGYATVLVDVTRERELDRMKTDFISTAAHELRTPLTTILGFSEIIVNRPEMEKRELLDLAHLVYEKSLSLTKIVSDLLDISRIESGQGLLVRYKEHDLGAIYARKIEEFKNRFPQFSFELKLDQETHPAVVDEFKIEQILENLLSNSVKYIGEGEARVELSLTEVEEGYLTTVRDNGVGMTQEQVRRIFERFYRGHAAHGEQNGAGLGMGITRHVVRTHGGRIWVESTPGEGTAVHFILKRDPTADKVGLAPKAQETTGTPEDARNEAIA